MDRQDTQDNDDVSRKSCRSPVAILSKAKGSSYVNDDVAQDGQDNVRCVNRLFYRPSSFFIFASYPVNPVYPMLKTVVSFVLNLLFFYAVFENLETKCSKT